MMRRSLLIACAVIVVLLACTFTDSVAGSKRNVATDQTTLVGNSLAAPPTDVDDGGDDQVGGDADGIHGLKDGRQVDGGATTYSHGGRYVLPRWWWSLMFWFR